MLFSMGGSRSYFAEGLNRRDASLLLVNTTSNLTCRLQQMFLLFSVMEILWTIFSSFSYSLGWSSRSKMPREMQWSPPETHFRAVSPADQGDRDNPLGCGLGSSGEPDTICHQVAAQRLHCPTAFTGEAQNPPEG